jgi:uncharacterized membrane protein YfcA
VPGVSPTTVAIVVAVCAIAGAVQTLTGFGYALVSTPLLAPAIGAKESVVLSVLLGTLTALSMSYGYRHHVDRPIAARMVVGRLVGMPLGVAVLVVVSEDTLRLAIAGSVCVATYVIWRGVELRGTGIAVDLGAGLVSGVLTTSVSTGGPPLVLAMHARGMSPDRFRGTMSFITVFTSAVAIALLVGADRVNHGVRVAALVGLPGVILGMLAGRALAPRVAVPRFRQIVLVLLVTSAAIAAASVLAS